MTRFTTFRRFAAIAAMVGCIGAAAVKPASAETYDYWSSLVAHVDGHPVCGVRTNMSGGAKLSLMVVGDNVHMVAYNPNWTMRPPGTVTTTVTIDGETFRGTASIEDSHTLLLPNLTTSFLGAFRDGYDMEADYGGVRWHVDLTGSTAATDDMVQCVKEARLGLES